MKTEERLRLLFDRRLAEAASGPFYGEVRAVDETSRTCTVDVQGVQYEGVLLYAVENADLRGGVRFPAVGSKVLVARIDGSERLYVAMVSEVDKVAFTLGDDMRAECSAAGISVQVGDTSLRIDSDGTCPKPRRKRSAHDAGTAARRVVCAHGNNRHWTFWNTGQRG